ncbi:MAG: hypothetical protein ACM31K_09600 [Solirubrobacterales bacterium]|jgi:hypothetical protein
MPLQGHWQRVNTPLRETTARERRLAWLIGGLAALGAIAAVIAVIVTNSPRTAAGCIRVDLPSTMGGGTPQLCGDAAASFCGSRAAHAAPLNATALPKCREAGYE